MGDVILATIGYVVLFGGALACLAIFILSAYANEEARATGGDSGGVAWVAFWLALLLAGAGFALAVF